MNKDAITILDSEKSHNLGEKQMKWNDVDDKSKKGVDRRFVSCEEDYEINDIIDAIGKKNPNFTKDQIKTAVNLCCKKVNSPRPRSKFISCVEQNID